MIIAMHRGKKNDVTFRFLLFASLVGPIICDFKLLLLHTNDMHSRYEEVDLDTSSCQNLESNKCFGGFARVRAAVNSFRKEAKKKQMSTLYLDAGDVFQETIYYMEYKWKLAAKMMNLLRPDAMSLGNHEFDDGVKGLAPFVKKLKVPIVCCNINIDEEPSLKIKKQLLPSKVFNFKGTKVGVVGYLTQDITSKHLGKVKILDEIKGINKETERLKKYGVKIIIALGHSGYDKDKEIAEKVAEVDVVVGGHSHTYLHTGNNPSEIEVGGTYPTVITKETSKREVPVVQAFYGTKYLGRLELVFDDDGNLKEYKGSLVNLNGKQDKKILKKLKPYSKTINKKYRHKIGETKVLFDGARKDCRLKECNIGNLVADAFVDYANKNLPLMTTQEKVEIGLVDSKSMKSSLYPKGQGKNGDILLEDVMMVLPYGFNLEVLKLKGKVIRQALESGVNNYDPKNEGLLRAHLLQVAGLRVKFDMTKPRGSRLTDVLVAPDYQGLDDDASYNVVMANYLASNKDKFPMLIGQPRAGRLPVGVTDYDVLASYIKEHSPLSENNSPVEGRITVKE